MNRGEIWLVDLNPGFGREIHKKRPALIISENNIHTQSSHVIIIPISTQVPRAIGLEMVLVGKKEGLDKKSVVLPVFIRSIDKARLVKKVGVLSKAKMHQVEQALKLILALEEGKAS